MDPIENLGVFFVTGQQRHLVAAFFGAGWKDLLAGVGRLFGTVIGGTRAEREVEVAVRPGAASGAGACGR